MQVLDAASELLVSDFESGARQVGQSAELKRSRQIQESITRLFIVPTFRLQNARGLSGASERVALKKKETNDVVVRRLLLLLLLFLLLLLLLILLLIAATSSSS